MNSTGFTGDVVVTPIAPEGIRWRLVQSFTYQGKVDLFTVPKDLDTDFASVPRLFVWLLPRYGRWTQAAILHDYLWQSGVVSKFDADGIFNRALRELDVPFLRRWIMWGAVRWAAGPSTWFEKGIVPFLKMLLITIVVLPVVLPPALVVFVVLAIGLVSEYALYWPLRLLHRQENKTVNVPDPRELVVA